MKTQLSKPARSKARYTEEYKKEALPVVSAQDGDDEFVAILILQQEGKSLWLKNRTSLKDLILKKA